MTAEQGERCPVCEGLDQPGLLHNVNAPYCSASTEQGDVEALTDTIRYAYVAGPARDKAQAALDRLAATLLTAAQQNTVLSDALERAERERDEAREEVLFLCDDEDDIRKGLRARAEKAERALAAAELEKEGARRGEDEAWEKWQKAFSRNEWVVRDGSHLYLWKAERALAEQHKLADVAHEP